MMLLKALHESFNSDSVNTVRYRLASLKELYNGLIIIHLRGKKAQVRHISPR